MSFKLLLYNVFITTAEKTGEVRQCDCISPHYKYLLSGGHQCILINEKGLYLYLQKMNMFYNPMELA